MEERFIVAADLGASKISLSVSKVSSGVAEVVWYREIDSDGIVRGSIFNAQRASEPLKRLVEEAEKQLDIHINGIVVNKPRWNVKAECANFSIERSNPDDFITEEEVKALQGFAIDSWAHENDKTRSVYSAQTQSFSTSDMMHVNEYDIIGMTSDTMEGRYLIISGPSKPIQNIDKVLTMIDRTCADYKFTPELVAQNVLSEGEREHGVALVEIGASVTSVCIYHGGVMRAFGSFPFGGKSITSDISHECRIPERLAENIKMGYGSCTPDKLLNLTDKVLQINDNRSGECLNLPVKYLSEIINCRMSEIADAVLHIIGESGYSDSLRSGIVLVGGGAEMMGCCQLFSNLSGLPVRLGYPNMEGLIPGCFPEITRPEGFTQIAMIQSLLSDAHLNCATIEEAPRTTIFTEEDMENMKVQETEKNNKKSASFMNKFGKMVKDTIYNNYGQVNDQQLNSNNEDK